VEQPSGTVSFLFTDIEGSTRLLQELGPERYAAALGDHRRLIRDAFDERGGYEVDCEGDAFFVAFSSATSAVAAAETARQALAAHNWPEGNAIRVRMGIHTGQPLLAPPKYVGMDVHRAARIAAAGHGGQVLLSAATAEAVVADAFDLLDLGEHRFKDLSAAERVFQVGREAFPPIRSLFQARLPVPATPFLGRARELAEVVAMLTRDGMRLLTLTGPGGTGKTRLALQAAAEASAHFPDGVDWVPLAALRDPDLVLPSIAQALDVDARGDGLADRLGASLAGTRRLVVLDNAEHLLPALARDIARLVVAAEPVRFAITSRERLTVREEHVYPVGTLDDETGVELFVERAAAAGVALVESDTVRSLCEQLDQLPLAIELAAARTVLFTPEQLHARLAERLDLLKAGRDVDPRQQTLRAAIEWSYDLLDERERRLLGTLAVFVGGCTYEAAEEVTGADPDLLQSLIAKSLLRRRDAVSGARFWMLETIRGFARELLAVRDDAVAIRRAHAEWYAALAERAAPELAGAEQGRWLQLLESDHDNIRAALTRAHEAHWNELALRLSAALQSFWYKHGHIEEGRRWLERGLTIADGQAPALRARIVQAAGVFAGTQGDSRRARELAELGLALYEGLGDRRGTAIMLRDLGAAAVRGGEHAEATAYYERSAALLEELGEHTLLATALANLGDVAFRQGDLGAAADRTREALALQREIGATFGVAISLSTLGFIALQDGRDEDARIALEESMLLAHELGSSDNLAYAFEGLAAVAATRRDWGRAAALLGRAEALREATATELEEAEQLVHERTLSALLGAGPAPHEEIAAGARLSDEQTIALAQALA
jgi:predicted ATPase/class 3 adenylate cyclase